MAFTDAEMAVLSQLVYSNKVISGDQKVSLKDILNNPSIMKTLKNDLGDQYNDVIDGLVKKSKDYTIVLSQNDEKTGFAAMAIAGPDNDVTVVTRGTEGFDILGSEESRKDVLNGDYGLIAGTGETQQHKQMEKFLDKLNSKNNYDSFYFTGHSLGGNLAMYGAVYMAKSGKVKGTTVFNAPNFNDAFVNKYKKQIEIISPSTKQIQNENDVVSSINGHNAFGSIIICETADNDSNPLDFDDHMLDAFNISDDNFVVSDGEKYRGATVLGDIATNGDIIIKGAATTAILTLASGAGIVSAGLITIGVTLTMIVTVAVISYVSNKIKEWLFKNSSGYKYATSNPYIVINTTTMDSYAKQLRILSKRAKTLDGKMNNLYWYLGIEWDTIANLGKLLKAGAILDFAYRLDKCANYLSDTARDFDAVERDLQGMC